MPKRILDEFTHLPLSRQRKYQLRNQRNGRCTECGDPIVSGGRCLRHLVDARERAREARKLKRRYNNTLSYRLQADPEAVIRDLKNLKARLSKAQKLRSHPPQA